MKVQDRFKGFVVERVLERPARHQGLAQQTLKLEAAGRKLERRLQGAKGTEKDKAALRHIIGIERWGSRRVALVTQNAASEAVLTDGHTPHKPVSDDWQTLIAEFSETRKETLALAQSLNEAQATAEVPHNDLGPLSVGAWLHYLRLHASLEGRRVR